MTVRGVVRIASLTLTMRAASARSSRGVRPARSRPTQKTGPSLRSLTNRRPSFMAASSASLSASIISPEKRFCSPRAAVAINVWSACSRRSPSVMSVQPPWPVLRVPVDVGRVRSYDDASDVCEVVERLPSSLSTDAGFLHSSPGGRRVETMVVVDPYHPRLNARRDAMSAGNVLSPHRRAEPVADIVGFFQSIVFVGERYDHGDGSEDLLL